MLGVLLAIHVLVTMLLIMVILIQKSEGGSSLFASGAGNGMFTARGTSDILTKASWVLGACFLLNCILMAHISSKNIKEATSIINDPRLKSVVISNNSNNTKSTQTTNKTKKTTKSNTKNSKTKNQNTDNKSTPSNNMKSQKPALAQSYNQTKPLRSSNNNQKDRQ